jgi:hypothetical protein
MIELWEIFVPTIRPDGKPYRTRYHRVWDDKVRKISGGLTIYPPAKGQWVSPTGELFKEKMIPVRIACTEEQISSIMEITLTYYSQEAVLAYRISDKVLLLKNGK